MKKFKIKGSEILFSFFAIAITLIVAISQFDFANHNDSNYVLLVVALLLIVVFTNNLKKNIIFFDGKIIKESLFRKHEIEYRNIKHLLVNKHGIFILICDTTSITINGYENIDSLKEHIVMLVHDNDVLIKGNIRLYKEYLYEIQTKKKLKR